MPSCWTEVEDDTKHRRQLWGTWWDGPSQGTMGLCPSWLAVSMRTRRGFFFSSTFCNKTIVLLKRHHRASCQDVTKHVAVRNYPFIIPASWLSGRFCLSWPHWKFLCPGRSSAYCCFWYPANWPMGILTSRFPSCKIPKVLFLIHMTCEFLWIQLFRCCFNLVYRGTYLPPVRILPQLTSVLHIQGHDHI